ncbi:MAG: alkaline phosphatase D family protein [Planctomycetota bacterium]
MKSLSLCTVVLALLATVGLLTATQQPSIAEQDKTPVIPIAGMGIMVGGVTSDSALVQVRLTKTDYLKGGDVPGAPGIVEFSAIPAATGVPAAAEAIPVSTVAAMPDFDFIARTRIQGLKPGTRYVCFTRIGADRDSLVAGPVAQFRTLPGKDSTASTKFVVVTGMNYAKFHGDNRIDRKVHLLHNNTELPRPYDGPDKALGYPGLASILRLQPDFFVGTGDNVYYDTPKEPRAETVEQMRQKWHEQFVQPRYRDLFAKVPTYWEVDDHDYRIDDGDNSGDYRPTVEEGRRLMLEQLPYGELYQKDVKTYRTHRVNRDLQIWLTENRWYRSPNEMPDGPEKSIWGSEQKAWLKKTLVASDAKYKILVSPTPMIGPDDARKIDNHADINGFQHERDEFFAWLKETGLDKENFYIVCGDRHWQYHAIDPSGIEEFSCGALVDANSRLGRKAGDPESTDPDGLIKQPYLQNPRSGGFLMISVSPLNHDADSVLRFEWHDEHGKLLHRTVKE